MAGTPSQPYRHSKKPAIGADKAEGFVETGEIRPGVKADQRMHHAGTFDAGHEVGDEATTDPLMLKRGVHHDVLKIEGDAVAENQPRGNDGALVKRNGGVAGGGDDLGGAQKIGVLRPADGAGWPRPVYSSMVGARSTMGMSSRTGRLGPVGAVWDSAKRRRIPIGVAQCVFAVERAAGVAAVFASLASSRSFSRQNGRQGFGWLPSVWLPVWQWTSLLVVP